MVVLITGSSSGIGRETALKFASNGYDVVINYCSNEKVALDIKRLVLSYGVKCLCIKCDISCEEEVKTMIDTIASNFNNIDCLVNNASIAIDSMPLEKDIKNFKKILNVNLIGTYLVSKYALKYMKTGCIVNVSSTNGIDTYYPYSLDYDCSKAGVISLTHNFALMLAPNIRVNAVCPGWVDTPMNKNLDLEFKKEENKKILLKRFAFPDEIANVIYFLCSSEASYINNSVIRVDGGFNGSC